RTAGIALGCARAARAASDGIQRAMHGGCELRIDAAERRLVGDAGQAGGQRGRRAKHIVDDGVALRLFLARLGGAGPVVLVLLPERKTCDAHSEFTQPRTIRASFMPERG